MNAGSAGFKRSSPIRWLGLSFLLAWAWVAMFPNQSLDSSPVGYACFAVGGGGALVVLSALPQNLSDERHGRSACILFASLASVASLVLCLGEEWRLLTLEAAAINAIAMVEGAVFTLALAYWVSVYARLKMDAMTISIMFSLALSALLNYFLWMFRPEYWGAVWALLPLLSVLCLYSVRDSFSAMCGSRLEESEEPLVLVSGALRIRVVFLIGTGLVIGFTTARLLSIGPCSGILVPAGIGLAGVASVVALWMMFSRKNGTTILQYTCVLGITALAVLSLIEGPAAFVVLQIVLGALIAFSLFFVVALVVDVGVTFNLSWQKACLNIALPAQAAVIAGVAVWFLADAALGDAVSVFAFLGCLALSVFTLAWLLLCRPTWIAYEMSETGDGYTEQLVVPQITEQISELREKLSLDGDVFLTSGPEGEKGDAEYWQRRIEEVSAEYDLSVRQAEVFAHLTRGRNADYIANKLVISPNTVRTHISIIYRKLDIHTQQELLNFFYRE